MSPTLTLNLLTTTIVAPPSNASKWQMGFNSAFKGLKEFSLVVCDKQLTFAHFFLGGDGYIKYIKFLLLFISSAEDTSNFLFPSFLVGFCTKLSRQHIS